jgi:hypothetical protein
MLIEVLLLHGHLDRTDVLAGITAALSVGSTRADVVAVEAREAAQHGATAEPEASTPQRPERVVSPTERRLAALPGEAGSATATISFDGRGAAVVIETPGVRPGPDDLGASTAPANQ